MNPARAVIVLLQVGLVLTVGTAAQSTTAPVPRPFPGSGAASAPTSPGPATAPRPPEPIPPATGQQVAAPPPTAPSASAAAAGAPIYPTADYLDTFDAGLGQKYVLYGTNAAFAEIVTYYRTVLKTGGRELFRAPATHQFDLGRFTEGRMAYPPSVVIKDYTWNNSPGYLFVAGTTEKRYKTIIQIVAPGPTP